HAGRDHRKTEQGSQRQRCRSETPSATCRSGRHGAWRVPRRFRQADLRRGQEVEQGDAGGQYQAGMNSRRAAALRNFDPAYVGSGSESAIRRCLLNVRFAPESGPTSRSRNYSLRQLLANAAIAASRVASRRCAARLMSPLWPPQTKETVEEKSG